MTNWSLHAWPTRGGQGATKDDRSRASPGNVKTNRMLTNAQLETQDIFNITLQEHATGFSHYAKMSLCQISMVGLTSPPAFTLATFPGPFVLSGYANTHTEHTTSIARQDLASLVMVVMFQVFISTFVKINLHRSRGD